MDITIEEYLKPSKFAKIIGIILIVVSLSGFGLVGLDSLKNTDNFLFKKEIFDPTQKQDGIFQLVEIDIYAVDGYAYQTGDDYYFCGLEDNGLITLKLTPQQFRAMEKQYNFWKNGSDQDKAKAERYHLIGKSRYLPDDILKEIAGTYKLSEKEMLSKIGDYYLDCTNIYNVIVPLKNELLIITSISALVFGIIALIVYVDRKSKFKKSIERLHDINLYDKATYQLNDCLQKGIDNHKQLFADDVMFSKSQSVVIAYSDIRWAYIERRKQNFVLVSSSLIVHTKDKRKFIFVTFSGKGNQEVFDNIFQLINTKNPEALIGFSDENKKIFHGY